MEKFRKSVNICQSYGQKYRGPFFDSQCSSIRPGCQPTEAVPDMPVGTLCRTFLNAANTLYLLSDAIWNIFTSRSTSTPSTFDVIAVKALCRLLTCLLTYLLTYYY